MKKQVEKKLKYIFCFAGSWKQFQDWRWRNGLDDDFIERSAHHLVYVDRWEKVVGYTREVYKDAEIVKVGTFPMDASDEAMLALDELENRIDTAKFESRKQ